MFSPPIVWSLLTKLEQEHNIKLRRSRQFYACLYIMQEVMRIPFNYSITFYGCEPKVWSESGYDSIESYTHLDLDGLIGERGWFTTIPHEQGEYIVAVDSPRVMSIRQNYFANIDQYSHILEDTCLLIQEVEPTRLNIFAFWNYLIHKYPEQTERDHLFEQWYGGVTLEQRRQVFSLLEKWSSRFQLV